jgi:hypothetical protein
MDAPNIPTLVVALLSAVVAALSAYLSNEARMVVSAHNRLSVRPIINMMYEKSSKYVKEEQSTMGTLSIVLINNGIGPAIVESFDLFVGDERIIAKDDLKWEHAVLKLFPVDGENAAPKRPGDDVFNLSKGYCIPARERLVLFKMSFTIEMDSYVHQCLDRSRAVLVFQSLYKKFYVYDTDKVKRGEIDSFDEGSDVPPKI